MSRTPHLVEVGAGQFAWLQPDGAWGLNNAGLVVDGDQSLLVDTLYDRKRTQVMVDAMRAATSAAASIDTLVNTHANGDHCYGNGVAEAAEIIASARASAEMAELPPEKVAKLMKVSRTLSALGPARPGLGALAGLLGLKKLAWMAEAAPFVKQIFAAFDFEDLAPQDPTRTFEGTLELTVGDRRVDLIELGPAHTKGDVIVWVPDSKVVYTGDLLFVGGHPVAWEGPVSNWIAACQAILDLGAETVVPGHGPLTDAVGVRAVLEYLQTLEAETKARHAAGMSRDDCIAELYAVLQPTWTERERVAVNVSTIYRELDGSEPMDPVEAFALMARLALS